METVENFIEQNAEENSQKMSNSEAILHTEITKPPVPLPSTGSFEIEQKSPARAKSPVRVMNGDRKKGLRRISTSEHGTVSIFNRNILDGISSNIGYTV